jgi:hypothetical protein
MLYAEGRGRGTLLSPDGKNALPFNDSCQLVLRDGTAITCDPITHKPNIGRAGARYWEENGEVVPVDAHTYRLLGV